MFGSAQASPAARLRYELLRTHGTRTGQKHARRNKKQQTRVLILLLLSECLKHNRHRVSAVICFWFGCSSSQHRRVCEGGRVASSGPRGDANRRHARRDSYGLSPISANTMPQTLLYTITHITLYNSPPQPRGARRDLSPAEGAAVNLPGAHARAAEHVATDVDHDVLPSLHAHLARRRSARRLQLPLRL